MSPNTHRWCVSRVLLCFLPRSSSSTSPRVVGNTRSADAPNARPRDHDAVLTDDPAPIASRSSFSPHPHSGAPDARPPTRVSAQLRAPDAAAAETGASEAATDSRAARDDADEGDALCGVRLGFDGVFATLSVTFIACVSVSCVAEEFMYKHLPGFDYFWTVAFAELLVFTLASFAGAACAGSLGSVLRDRRAPLRLYVAQAIVMAIYAAIAKIAYKYLNYATGTVLRSTKLVFVMAVSAAWLKRRYALVEVTAAAAMIVAVACFGLGEEASGAGRDENHWIGYVLSFAGLALAALQTNMAEHAMRDHGASTLENMLYVNGIGLVVVAAVAAYVDGAEAVAFLRETPHAMDLLAARSITFYFGALTFTELTRHSGATPATTVATARKGLTVLGSFLLFPGDKPMSAWFALGVAAFIVAIALELKGRMVRAESRKKEATGSQ